MSEHILHPTVYLKDRRHQIDIYVYPACKLLWDAGIKTFYSCQGGPQMKNGKLVSTKAYVVVRRKDLDKALKVLTNFHPRYDNNLLFKRCSIKFNACEEADRIPLIIERVKTTYKHLV